MVLWRRTSIGDGQPRRVPVVPVGRLRRWLGRRLGRRFGRRFGLSLLLCAAVLALACGGDEGAGPAAALPAELEGEWVAGTVCAAQGCGYAVYSRNNPADSLSLTGIGSVTVFLTLMRQGSYDLQLVSAGGTQRTQGSLQASGNTLLLANPGTGRTDTATYRIANQLLLLDYRTDIQIPVDVNGDGQPDSPLGVRAAFARR
jgi:hypothetical protein